MPSRGTSGSDDLVEQLITTELLARRSATAAALSALYLRGTVLLALTSTELLAALAANIGNCEKLIASIFLLIPLIMSLAAFWPQKENIYKISVLRKNLQKNVPNAQRALNEFLDSEFSDAERSIARRTLYVSLGFTLTVIGLVGFATLVILGA